MSNAVGIHTKQRHWSVEVPLLLGILPDVMGRVVLFASASLQLMASCLAARNEHCTWPRVGLYPNEFESSFIEFKVYARLL